MKAVLALTFIAASGFAALPAWSDEVWDTKSGRVVYEDEIGPTAVWTYGSADNPGVIYLLGLAKVYENRASYTGYWAKNQSKKACDTQRPGIQGKMTSYWGRFNVKFLDKNFPSRWEATWSYCDDADEAEKLMATPVFGNTQAAPTAAVPPLRK
ncbi:hypothetical protein [Thiolinea disciformis]|uniref:hypothetical protein n=1 Tax=Thiolinea disciformis TaxID=125614 RepID=UPI00035DDE7F|nr:hypothetical protein [Thiolinea disciformis]